MNKKNLGIGFLRPSLIQNYPLYRSFDDSKPFDTLGIRQNADGTLSFTTKTLGGRLKPYRMFRGDSHEEAQEHVRMGLVRLCPELAFRVIEKTEDDHPMRWDAEHRENIYAHDKFSSSFLVVLNEETGETAVIRAAHGTVPPQGFPVFGMGGGSSLYETWEQYLTRAEFIQPLIGEYLLFNKPEGEIIFKHENTPFLSVLAVEGDYIKTMLNWERDWVKNLKDAEGRPFPKESWLRWREGDKLLIRIVEYMLE